MAHTNDKNSAEQMFDSGPDLGTVAKAAGIATAAVVAGNGATKAIGWALNKALGRATEKVTESGTRAAGAFGRRIVGLFSK